jgi:hypothetical protein
MINPLFCWIALLQPYGPQADLARNEKIFEQLKRSEKISQADIGYIERACTSKDDFARTVPLLIWKLLRERKFVEQTRFDKVFFEALRTDSTGAFLIHVSSHYTGEPKADPHSVGMAKTIEKLRAEHRGHPQFSLKLKSRLKELAASRKTDESLSAFYILAAEQNLAKKDLDWALPVMAAVVQKAPKFLRDHLQFVRQVADSRNGLKQ